MTPAGWKLDVHGRDWTRSPQHDGPHGGEAAVRDRRGATWEEILEHVWDFFWHQLGRRVHIKCGRNSSRWVKKQLRTAALVQIWAGRDLAAADT